MGIRVIISSIMWRIWRVHYKNRCCKVIWIVWLNCKAVKSRRIIESNRTSTKISTTESHLSNLYSHNHILWYQLSHNLLCFPNRWYWTIRYCSSLSSPHQNLPSTTLTHPSAASTLHFRTLSVTPTYLPNLYPLTTSLNPTSSHSLNS